MIYTCTKIIRDIPFAHRQHNHNGHCALIHGHNWEFHFSFTAEQLDINGFVLDFGGEEMQALKKFVNDHFDHALVLNAGDPQLPFLRAMLVHATVAPLAKLTVVPSASCEGLAEWLFDNVGLQIRANTLNRVRLCGVAVREDNKNSAHCSKYL